MKRSAPTRLSSVGQLRRAAKVGDWPARPCRPRSSRPRRSASPTASRRVPKGVVVPPDVSTLGANFETDWAR